MLLNSPSAETVDGFFTTESSVLCFFIASRSSTSVASILFILSSLDLCSADLRWLSTEDFLKWSRTLLYGVQNNFEPLTWVQWLNSDCRWCAVTWRAHFAFRSKPRNLSIAIWESSTGTREKKNTSSKNKLKITITTSGIDLLSR